MSRVLLEVCVDDAAGLNAAVAGGADRVELCSALSVGGLTPSAGLMAMAGGAGIPAVAMIRPRAGGFVFSDDDVATMFGDIAQARAAGLAGVVLGAAGPDGRLDTELLARLGEAAEGMELCLHRVFDLTPDPFEAVDSAVGLGFSRILTSGLAPSVPEGLETLRRIAGHARGRLSILPGGGITRDNVGDVVRAIGTREIHASCSRVVPGGHPDEERFGFAPAGGRRATDADLVAEMRRTLALVAAVDEMEQAREAAV